MSQQLPPKLLRFKNAAGKQGFWPLSSLRGIEMDSNHMVFYFTPVKNAIGEGNTDTRGESDLVKVLFNSGEDGQWTAVINLWNKLLTGKSYIYTVADVDSSTADGGYFFGFGSADSNVNVSNLTNTVTIEYAS